MKKFAMPVVFLCTFLAAMLCTNFLPVHVQSFFCSISLVIKECMLFVMPFVIFSLVSSSLYRIGVLRSVKSLLAIIPLICCSNFFNTCISYLLGNFCVKTGLVIASIGDVASRATQPLIPPFSISLRPIISNDSALLSGVILGLLCSRINCKKISSFQGATEAFVRYFFKILLPLMPLFIFGAALKLSHDGTISMIASEYFVTAIIFLLSCCSYILLQLFLLAGCSIKKATEHLRNLLSAIIAGFGATSSITALPLSIAAAEKNLSNKHNAGIIIPCSVNIHLVGDCFFIPFMALTMLFQFGHGFPDIATYLTFALYFVAAKFAVAAVPGGGILVMLPVLQNYLGFNSEMLGLITAIYVLFDPFITGCNVAGNGSLSIIFDKIAEQRE